MAGTRLPVTRLPCRTGSHGNQERRAAGRVSEAGLYAHEADTRCLSSTAPACPAHALTFVCVCVCVCVRGCVYGCKCKCLCCPTCALTSWALAARNDKRLNDRPSTPLHVSPPAPRQKERPDSAPPRASHSTNQSSPMASSAIPRRLMLWGEAERILGADLAGDLVSNTPALAGSEVGAAPQGGRGRAVRPQTAHSPVGDLNGRQPSATATGTAGLGRNPSAILTPRLAPRHARPSWRGVAGNNTSRPTLHMRHSRFAGRPCFCESVCF